MNEAEAIEATYALIDAVRKKTEDGGVPPVPPVASGNDRGDNGDMEARVAKLESAVQYIQRDIAELKSDIKEMRGDLTSIRTTDFRILFGAIVTVAVGLAGIMAKGFGWL